MRTYIGSHQVPNLAFREGLDFSLEGMWRYGGEPGFQGIRKELGGFLFDLQRCRSAGSSDEQVHYLFLALMHLDKLEQEIRTSSENDEIIRLGMVLDRITSLRTLIAGYIRYLQEA